MKGSNHDLKEEKKSTAQNQFVKFPIFTLFMHFTSLEVLLNSLFLSCESLHNLFVVFQDLLHRKFDFLFIWKLKAKCSRVSQADLSPLSLCMGEGRFFAHFAFCISNFAFAICIFAILHSVLCILYFAFCICILTSWHFHHSTIWLLNDLHNLIQTSIIKR